MTHSSTYVFLLFCLLTAQLFINEYGAMLVSLKHKQIEYSYFG